MFSPVLFIEMNWSLNQSSDLFFNASIRASFSSIRLTATRIHCFPLLVVLHQRSEVRGDFIYHFGIREVRIHQVAEAQHL